ALGDDREILVQIDVSGHFDHGVHATAACRFHDGVEVVGLVMIDDHVCTPVSHSGKTALGAAGADDPYAARPSELDGRGPDAAGGAVHQHGFPGDHPGA